ncbi:ABC transporter permease [Gordonia hydrophobica]|uniref:ABC transporter permease n=1 Tax=Gordonia hydrophobica TaxID=40516 RepID=A0ABZ2U5C8_9ACTN|nr:ABC transporter permease [Gordonia hydrophobica]MBM7368766.1 ABC-2 type transport system permease protein [Gordonia hydrophobica]
MTTAATGYRRRPLAALATAEFTQFRRNKTLVVTALIFPVVMPLGMFLLTKRDGVTAESVGATFDMYALFALMFVQFYTVLSLVTTRRGEGVLKRLRTGEAADWQILTAPAMPGVAVTTATAIVVASVVYAFGAPAPVNPVLMVLGLAVGSVLFTLLALATTAFTKNAEAAQITSLPVIALAMVGAGNMRAVLPERAAEILGYTPFAAVSDLVNLGAAGKTAIAGSDAAATDFVGSFSEIGQPLVTLAVWTAVSIALVYKCFRWDDRE